MRAQGFCRKCGMPRAPAALFCGSCGVAFDSSDSTVTATGPQPASGTPSHTLALLAGLCWLIAGALTGALAYQQWTLSLQLASPGQPGNGPGSYVAWNMISAVVSTYFGARMLAGAARVNLRSLLAWSVVSVATGLLQIGDGATGPLVLTILASAAAGILAFVARLSAPPDVQGPRCVHCGHIVANEHETLCDQCGLPFADRWSSWTAERFVVALILVAVVGGGVLLIPRTQVDQALAEVTSFFVATDQPARPLPATPPPATPPPATPHPTIPVSGDALVANLGEPIDIVNRNQDALGSITVVKAGKPQELLGSPPQVGYRYIAARVNYVARAAWKYTVFDWLAHDARRFQYRPLGYAPNPPLEYGQITSGEQSEGWVAFEVPVDVREVWLDFRIGSGEIIFSVQID